MNQSDSGWRKRQIALDIKAKNARELGLNYEPELLERLVALARAQEREACAKLCDWLNGEPRLTPTGCAAAIRARGQHDIKENT